MVYGTLSEHELYSLAVIKGNQTAWKYIAMLEEYLLQFANEISASNGIFQQDNAPSDKEKVGRDRFVARHIKVM